MPAQPIRQICAGRLDHAVEMLNEVPELATLCQGVSTDNTDLLRRFAAYLQAPAIQNVRALEASSAPDLCKTARKQRIQRKLTPHHVQKRRIHFEAIFSADGESVDGPEEVVVALKVEWGPVLRRDWGRKPTCPSPMTTS